MRFAAQDLEPLSVDRPQAIRDMYLLSPFVWRDGERWKMLLRVVPRSDNPAEKIARIHYGESGDGLRFRLEMPAAIAPGPDAIDQDGCEDPTVWFEDDRCYVYYTGWNQTADHGQLLFAEGSGALTLRKRGIAIPWTVERKNPKEATIARVRDGSLRMFFEYAADGRSKIGLARAGSAEGSWTIGEPLFEARAGGWDSWHLSTGPIERTASGDPVMFYNGATRDAAWRIGWVVFDRDFTRVLARCGEPLIVPPAPREPGDTDIAFAASAVAAGDSFYLYYSVADKDMIRAKVRAL